MNKLELIATIKKITNNFGEFTTSQVEADSSPCISSKVGRNGLCETFTCDTVEVVTYDKDDFEIDRAFVPYHDLSEDVLRDILYLAELHEAQSLKDEENF